MDLFHISLFPIHLDLEAFIVSRLEKKECSFELNLGRNVDHKNFAPIAKLAFLYDLYSSSIEMDYMYYENM